MKTTSRVSGTIDALPIALMNDGSPSQYCRIEKSVRSQVPHHAHTALVEAEVDPARRAEVDLAELTASSISLTRLTGGEYGSVADHEHAVALGGRLDHD